MWTFSAGAETTGALDESRHLEHAIKAIRGGSIAGNNTAT